MSDKRTVMQTPAVASEGKRGWQMPTVGALTGKVGKAVGGCLVLVIGCFLAFTVAGWWGWNEIKPLSYPRPAMINAGAAYDPLDCKSRGMWVVKVDGQYSCTPAWK